MHLYSYTPDRRQSIAYFLIAFGIGASFLVNLIPKIPWYIDIVGPTSISAFFWWLFDQFFWRFRVGASNIAGIPNFGGLWSGTIITTGGSAPLGVEISQTWSRFYLISRTPRTRTISLMAAMSKSDREVRYEFVSSRRDETKAQHGLGTMRLISSEGIQGSFNSEGDIGTFTLARWSGTSDAFEIEHSWEQQSYAR